MRDDERWDAVVRRDKALDGVFVFAVKTTGIYCRPGCAARTPRRENVRFFGSAKAAAAAGFRACKRCRPDAVGLVVGDARAVASVCELIERKDGVGLAGLAAEAGMSSSHFHRVFKAQTGLTPKGYAAAHRAQRVKDGLRKKGASVTAAMYGAGFSSSGRFYAGAKGELGMTPSAFKKGGAGMRIRFAVGECTLGAILVAATEVGICSIALGDEASVLIEELRGQFSAAEIVGGDRAFEKTVSAVIAFVEKPSMGLGLPLEVRGTAFQRRVWEALRKIPAGETVSYAELAERLGNPKGVRAVAGACAANRIAVAIPCHRVVRTGGGMAGYRWGIERKGELIRREAFYLAEAQRLNR